MYDTFLCEKHRHKRNLKYKEKDFILTFVELIFQTVE